MLSATQVEERELNFYTQNCYTVGTQAALLAGFAFTGIVEAPWEYISESTSPASQYPLAYEMKFVCVASTILGMLCEVLCVVKSVQVSILGPGLAIRGPEGSMTRALTVMRLELARLHWQFYFGVFFYHIATATFMWCLFADPVISGTCIAIIFTALVWCILDCQKIAQRLWLPPPSMLWIRNDGCPKAPVQHSSYTGASVDAAFPPSPLARTECGAHAADTVCSPGITRQKSAATPNLPSTSDELTVRRLITNTVSEWNANQEGAMTQPRRLLREATRQAGYFWPGGGTDPTGDVATTIPGVGVHTPVRKRVMRLSTSAAAQRRHELTEQSRTREHERVTPARATPNGPAHVPTTPPAGVTPLPITMRSDVEQASRASGASTTHSWLRGSRNMAGCEDGGSSATRAGVLSAGDPHTCALALTGRSNQPPDASQATRLGSGGHAAVCSPIPSPPASSSRVAARADEAALGSALTPTAPPPVDVSSPSASRSEPAHHSSLATDLSECSYAACSSEYSHAAASSSLPEETSVTERVNGWMRTVAKQIGVKEMP